MRARARVSRDATGDRGSITLLSLGFAILAILLILVGAAATGIQIDRMRLQHAADELALDAADAMNVAQYYAGAAPRPGPQAGIAVSSASVRAVAQARLPEITDRYGLEGLRLESASSPDGRTATVTVSVVTHPLFGLVAWMPWGDVTLTAASSARVH